MAESAPLIVTPAMVTALFVPTALSAKLPVALPAPSVTASPLITPDSAAAAVLSVAVVEPSYTLSFAVMPVTVSAIAVMLAVAAGCISV